MSIIYTLIANKIDNVICDYTDNDGNFEQITRLVLNKEVEPDSTKALQIKNYRYHYINENKITFLSFSQGIEDSTMIAFLREIKNSLYKTYEYETIVQAQANQLKSFSKNIQELISYYIETPRMSVRGEVINDLQEVKKMMTKNITDLIERGVKLDIIVKKSEKLRTNAENVAGFVSIYMIYI